MKRASGSKTWGAATDPVRVGSRCQEIIDQRLDSRFKRVCDGAGRLTQDRLAQLGDLTQDGHDKSSENSAQFQEIIGVNYFSHGTLSLISVAVLMAKSTKRSDIFIPSS